MRGKKKQGGGVQGEKGKSLSEPLPSREAPLPLGSTDKHLKYRTQKDSGKIGEI